MKLILTKKNNRGERCRDGVKIGKSSFSISGNAFDRLANGKDMVYASIGINEEGNVCLYISYKYHDLLYRMYVPKSRENVRSIHVSLNTIDQKKAVAPYIGNYSIKFISVDERKGITEVVLIKN